MRALEFVFTAEAAESAEKREDSVGLCELSALCGGTKGLWSSY